MSTAYAGLTENRLDVVDADYAERLLECRTKTLSVQKIKCLLLIPLSWFAAIIFLCEEAIWDWTAALVAKLDAVRLVHAVEKHIATLPPHWALFTFLLPSLILIPAKLVGLHAITAATGSSQQNSWPANQRIKQRIVAMVASIKSAFKHTV